MRIDMGEDRISKQKRVLLLGAGFTTRNMGVWALASGAVSSVLHAEPNAKVYFFDYHQQPETYKVKHPGGIAVVDLINIRFSKKFWLPNNIARLLLVALLIKAIPFRSLRKRFKVRNFWLHHIQTADIVGSIAGGDSFSDIYGLRRLFYVALPQILVLLLGKPLVLLPQTIGPFKSTFAMAVSRYILKRAQIVYSRDHHGFSAVRELLGAGYSRLEFCYDMGFVLESHIGSERIPRWITKLGRGVPLIGLNVSGLLYIGGYTRDNMFGLKVDYHRLILDIIHYFVRQRRCHIILMPHVFGAAENSESDVVACRKVFREAEEGLRAHMHLVEEGYDQHELKALIGRCDFFLGSRMHACIAAFSQCVPAVGLAYSRKFHGVFESIGMADLTLDLREHDHKSVIEYMAQSYERRVELRAKLEEKMTTVHERVLGLFIRFPVQINK
jgi:polysaccharide pyruvyl transferase WcaK-like protein